MRRFHSWTQPWRLHVLAFANSTGRINRKRRSKDQLNVLPSQKLFVSPVSNGTLGRHGLSIDTWIKIVQYDESVMEQAEYSHS